MFKKIFILFLIISFYGVPVKSKASSSYLWPLKEFKELSSIFGDYRSFHFHSGIDIPTQKKTGYEVIAPESGWVYRIYTSWWGYGKALYLKLDDGRLALFGHLSDFSPAVKKFVEQKQLEKQSYFLNTFLDKNQIRIEKGEIVGFSGETGAGGAHLHFELRDEKNQPLNPLTHGFWMEDSIPPVIKKIAFRPMGVNSFVNGKDELAIMALVSDSIQGQYTLNKAPILSGRIGLGISTYDKVGQRKPGIYRTSLYLDDKLIFFCSYDTFNFDKTWMVDLDRDFQLLREEKGHFYKLYVDSGNELNLYSTPNSDKGLINTERRDSLSRIIYTSRAHEVKILTEDVAGNSSLARFFVIFDKKPEIKITEIVKSEENYQIKGEIIDDQKFSRIDIYTSPVKELKWIKKESIDSTGENDFAWAENVKHPTLIKLKAVDESGLKSDPEYVLLNAEELLQNPANYEIKLDLNHHFRDDFLKFDLKFDSVPLKEPQVYLKIGGFEYQPLFVKRVDERSYEAVYPFSETMAKEVVLKVRCQSVSGDSATFVRKIPLSIVSPIYGGRFESEDGLADIKIDSGTVYKDIELRIGKKSNPKSLKKKGNTYSFEPKDIPFAKYAWVSLSYTGRNCNPQKLALYEYKYKSWRFVGNELDPNKKTISGKVRYLSSYVLLEDKKSPGIKIVYPKKWQRTKKRLPQIYAEIWDDLSGFGSEDGIRVTIDDLWAIPEYDPEKKILKTKPPQPLSYGWHTLKIVAEDRVGNTRVAKRKFKVIK
jgi:murein DD-endopeptidase MepM/ murein hydrolase activator NlpD